MTVVCSWIVGCDERVSVCVGTGADRSSWDTLNKLANINMNVDYDNFLFNDNLLNVFKNLFQVNKSVSWVILSSRGYTTIFCPKLYMEKNGILLVLKAIAMLKIFFCWTLYYTISSWVTWYDRAITTHNYISPTGRNVFNIFPSHHTGHESSTNESFLLTDMSDN